MDAHWGQTGEGVEECVCVWGGGSKEDGGWLQSLTLIY